MEVAKQFYKDELLVKVQKDVPLVRDNAQKHHVAVGGIFFYFSVHFFLTCVVAGFSVDKTKTRLVVCSTIDNLLKGAATQCLQNLNLSLGLPDEYEGIRGELNDKPRVCVACCVFIFPLNAAFCRPGLMERRSPP